MEEWKEYKLGDVCRMIPGFAFKSNEFGTGSNLAIKIKDIQPPYVETKNADNVDITRYGLEKLSKFIVHKGEFLLAMTGATIGKIGKYIDEEPAYINQRVLKFQDTGFISYEYLYYYLSTDIFQSFILNHIDSQSAQPNISSNTIGKYPIKVPSLNTQQKIASILKSLDDKIEVNRRINDNLEQQAQALFKSWFVDFEPFKDGEFVESELGMIPKGWRVAKIKDIPHTLNTGKRPKGGAITSGVPSIGAEQLKGLCNYDYTKTKYISKDYSQSIPKGKVIGYEVYLNRVGGKPGNYIQNTTMFGEGYPYENCYINDHVFKLDFMQNRGYNVYIFFTFLTSRIQKYLNACGGKAAIPVINKQNIDDIYIFLPENECVKKFGESVLPMINMIFKIGIESARLATLRDTLLPRLMSGELSVNDIKG